VKYDCGDVDAVKVTGNGWLCDSGGRKHRITKLGKRQFLENKKNHPCQMCGEIFETPHSRDMHVAKGWCWTRRTKAQQRAYRRSRTRNAVDPSVNLVSVRSGEGEIFKAVSKFVYLGSMVTIDGGANSEITRRVEKASRIVASLSRTWSAPRIPLKLKVRLFSSLISSVLLYNCECWTVRQIDFKTLNGFYFRALKKVTRRDRMGDSDEADCPSWKTLLSVTGLTPLENVLRERRMRWYGHLMRADESDGSRLCMVEEMKRKSAWAKQVLNDMDVLKLSASRADSLTLDRVAWRRTTSSHNNNSAPPPPPPAQGVKTRSTSARRSRLPVRWCSRK
jgi:hypothetical protein